jgi:hypothetical protein
LYWRSSTRDGVFGTIGRYSPGWVKWFFVTPERLAKIHPVLDKRQPDLTVLMERVHKPHNFSAILRSCDAVGVLEAHAIPARYGIPIWQMTGQSWAS